MTDNKRRILEALRAPEDDHGWIDRGKPPYSASEIARELGADRHNIARTLRSMVEQGLVVPEAKLLEVWADGLKSTQGRSGLVRRSVTGYWPAATIDEDRAAVAEYDAGRKARTDAILDKLLRMPG
jgi:hypothetical protein